MSWLQICDDCGTLSTDERAPERSNWVRVLALVTPIGSHAPGTTKHFCDRREAGDYLRGIAGLVELGDEVTA